MPVCTNVFSSIFLTAFYEAGGVALIFWLEVCVLVSFLALSERLVMIMKYKMMRSALQ